MVLTDKRRAWLTSLGSWFRGFRVDTGLWSVSSVNHRWQEEDNSPSLQVPALFALADSETDPVWLFAEAKRRMDVELPGTDRVPVGISQVGKTKVVCLELSEFLDILTDSLLMKLESLRVGMADEDDQPQQLPEAGAPTQVVEGLIERLDGVGEESSLREQVNEIFEEMQP